MEAVIFIGVQGAGKSTFYREQFFDTHIRINMDMLKTRHRERVLLQACLDAKQPFVVDNTNARVAERKGYLDAAKAVGFRAVGYFFRSELRAAIWRNSRRSDKKAIPVPGLIGTWKRLEPPTLEEGFDELQTVELTREGKFVVEPGLRYPE